MAEDSPRPRRLTVFAEVAAVLALVIALVGVIIALLAYEHDKAVEGGSVAATPVVTVTTPVVTITTYVPAKESKPTESPATLEAGPDPLGIAIVLGITILALIVTAACFATIEDGPIKAIMAAVTVAGFLAGIAWLEGFSLKWMIAIAIISLVGGFGASRLDN